MTVGYYLNALGIVNPLGAGKSEVSTGLFAGRTGGMSLQSGKLPDRSVFIGQVGSTLPSLSPELEIYDSRNNRLLLSALLEIDADIRAVISKYGPDRVAVILGTSTSGIGDNEEGISQKVATGLFPESFHYERQDNASLAYFTRDYYNLTGPAMTISTACTSSAKTLASAQRLMKAGFCDAAIVGGADTICRLTLNGFASLELLSEDLCLPFSRNRNGINIGEGAAVFVMSREESDVRVAGIGETSDAHHMSTPDPTGAGASNAMKIALEKSGMSASDIGYLNLHGTATVLNDRMEASAVGDVLGQVPASSTKAMTGHTLGAAGSTELAFLWLAMQSKYSNGLLPPHIWDGQVDDDIEKINLVSLGKKIDHGSRAMMTNSFAFGGNNISAVLVKE
ncbi:beta-ketoacyl-[acyl-carrier-protein] synthase family protein [Sneathiella marina]|uniref:Beta-ketoacyl-[acyl-carrier-protein] synthase family protein n=1 Tax=Sneathiella marina TaxID=2950108 RepID=A0ABY4W746_9PROT|nr:beta-ketoacyl-[acyl-carrier-protein] synthase family protein [Sneathiella marina]USG62624.1 beta-ketoacyl-[acyl-carrier-protein] synthase family protein [Sneathiella marina]